MDSGDWFFLVVTTFILLLIAIGTVLSFVAGGL
jgi:hypothetical protein